MQRLLHRQKAFRLKMKLAELLIGVKDRKVDIYDAERLICEFIESESDQKVKEEEKRIRRILDTIF